MADKNREKTPDGEQNTDDAHSHGVPGGARQNVRSGTDQGAVSRPGGATQHSGGALTSNAEQGTGPGRGAD